MMFFLYALISFIAIQQIEALSCRNEKNEFVDWFYIQKYRNGLDYAYIDATSARKVLTLSGKSLECDKGCAFGATLSPLFEKKQDYVRVLWNDNVPGTSSSGSDDDVDATVAHDNLRRRLQSGTSGHTKGIIGAAATGGFLLTHSIPAFPDMSFSKYTWGGASQTYAQSILCISLNATEVDKAAYGMQFNDPKTYSSYMPPSMSSKYPRTVQLIAGQRQANTITQSLKTVNGATFVQFAKSGKSNKELYSDLVQSHLRVDMLVETWRRPPQLDSYCRPSNQYNSINVDDLQIKKSNGAMEAYRYTTDHSKWAVSTNSSASVNWACVGDINRMSSQLTRGGGTVCSNCRILHYALSSLIKATEKCG